jgi:hypothetical protein
MQPRLKAPSATLPPYETVLAASTSRNPAASASSGYGRMSQASTRTFRLAVGYGEAAHSGTEFVRAVPS